METQMENKQIETPTDQPKEKEPRYKSYWHVMLIVVNLSLANFYFGYMLVYISTVDFGIVMKTWKVNMDIQTARGILTGCIPIGALFGSVLGKKLIHLLSRRKLILLINGCAIFSGCLLYITQLECLIIMRLIQGICVGMYTSIIPLTISQISPLQISGSTGAFTQIFCSVGTTFGYLLYYILSQAFSPSSIQTIWYYVFGFPLITLSIQTFILLFVFPYETPKYYLLHHQKSKAKDLISQLYKEKYVEQILQEKINDLEDSIMKENIAQSKGKIANNNETNPLPPARIASKVSAHSALSGVESQEPETSPIPIFTSIHLNVLRQFVGINAVVAYGGSIIKQAVPELKSIAPIILNFQTLTGAIVSIYLLSKTGRKTILQYGTFILAASMLLITIGFFIIDSSFQAGTALILTGLIVYMFTFGATLGSTIWLYTAQICEPSYIILATAITWIFASVVIVLFPILKNTLPGQSPVYLFLFFFLWTIVSFVVNHKVLIETKGKTQHQIHQQYKQMKILGFGGSAPVGTQRSIKLSAKSIENVLTAKFPLPPPIEQQNGDQSAVNLQIKDKVRQQEQNIQGKIQNT